MYIYIYVCVCIIHCIYVFYNKLISIYRHIDLSVLCNIIDNHI